MGGSAERALLGSGAVAEAALTDAALSVDPGRTQALAFEATTTPSALPTSAVLDEDAMLSDLIELLGSEDPLRDFVEYAVEQVTSGPAYLWFLRAAYRAPLVQGLADCPLDTATAMASATMLAETFGPFALSLAAELTGLVSPGTSLHVLVSANPGLATNSREFVLGMVGGFADSEIASAQTVYDLLIANAALTAIWPVHAACFVVGAIHQLLRDLYDTAATIIAAVGYLDDVIPLMCRLLQALPVALGRLLDAESASDVAQLGRNLGQMIASSLADDLPKITDASGYPAIASELIAFSYTCGTWFGPLLLDIVLSFVGIGYVEGAVRLLGKAVTCADDVLRWMYHFFRALFDAVDPGLMDELAALGAKLAARLDVRLTELAESASVAYGLDQQSIEDGLDVLEDALGSERFRTYAAAVFCTLEPRP
ncbi:MAG: hypothetical protein ACRCYQ_02650 [Nocardioides sp.]